MSEHGKPVVVICPGQGWPSPGNRVEGVITYAGADAPEHYAVKHDHDGLTCLYPRHWCRVTVDA